MGSCIDILNNWVYHRGLANTLLIRGKDGQAYGFRCFQFI